MEEDLKNLIEKWLKLTEEQQRIAAVFVDGLQIGAEMVKEKSA